MLHVPLASGSRVLAISVVTAILALSGASCGSMTGTMTIVNVDGPGVAVVPWSGGPTISVDCGTTGPAGHGTDPSYVAGWPGGD